MDYECHNNYFLLLLKPVTFNAMRDKKPLFFKGLPGYTRIDDTITEDEARDTSYYWWWSFMQLSPVFWYAKQTGHKPSDPKVAETYEMVGDPFDGSFYKWWNTTGKAVFSEAKRPAKVRKVDLNQIDRIELYGKSVIVEIPLTIRKTTIISQLKKLLASVEETETDEPLHAGRQLDLAATSTAKLSLHTKRFNKTTLEREYWVMIYRLLYPKVEIWRIGDRLRVAPQLKVQGVERNAFGLVGKNPFTQLHSLTGRYLYKAERTIWNIERGSFPNPNKVEIADNYTPFGKKYQQDYLAAIGKVRNEPAAWLTWLNEKYADKLTRRIVKVNHIEREYLLPDSLVRQRLPAFINGISDQLKR